jgi:GGDEF domain-containing protein
MGECAALVRSAEALRFSAPELAVQLARRALVIGAAEPAESGDVGQARALSMRAQAVLAAGLVRISHYVDAVEPAFAALALAEDDGIDQVAMSVRLDLASCSREVGEPLLGCALLRPVLETGLPQPAMRAAALGRLVGCIAHVGRRDDIEDALTEADRLLAADDGLSPDARRIERARLSVRAAAYHRWYGDTEDAAEAAREGLTQLNRLRGLRAETGRLRAQLVLELVCALLDEGSLAEAASVSDAVLAEPVRATSAAAVGQLMLAVSTRVHLPSGRVDRGRGLLDQAVWVAGRHGLDGLLADTLTASSLLDEDASRPVEALESLHGARAAEQRRLHAIARAGRRVLTEVGARGWDVQAVNAVLRQVIRATGHPVTAGATAPGADAWSSRPEGATADQAPPPERDDAGMARSTGQHADPLSAHEVAWSDTRRGELAPHAERHRASPPGSPGEQYEHQHRHSAPEQPVRPAAERTEPERQSVAGKVPSSGEPAPWSAREPAAAHAEQDRPSATGVKVPSPGESASWSVSEAATARAELERQSAAGREVSSSGEPASWAPRRSAAARAELERQSVVGGEVPPSSESGQWSARESAAARAESERQSVAGEVPSGEPAREAAAVRAESSAGELVSAVADRTTAQTDTDEATGLLNKEGLFRRLRSVRNGERPVALTLVRLENDARRDAGPDATDTELTELAGRVRNIAPDDAELARAGGAELAVLLPHTTHDQAERFAAAIESAWQGTSHGHGISTGVVQSNPDAPAVDARALLTAARHALTSAAPAPDDGQRYPRTVEELAALQDTDDTLRIGREIIRSLSISEGSGGKRRAGSDAAPTTGPGSADTGERHATTAPSGASSTEHDTHPKAWPATATADAPTSPLGNTDTHPGTSRDDTGSLRSTQGVLGGGPEALTAAQADRPTVPTSTAGEGEPADADRARDNRFTSTESPAGESAASAAHATTGDEPGDGSVGRGAPTGAPGGGDAGSGERAGTGDMSSHGFAARWASAGASGGSGNRTGAGEVPGDDFAGRKASADGGDVDPRRGGSGGASGDRFAGLGASASASSDGGVGSADRVGAGDVPGDGPAGRWVSVGGSGGSGERVGAGDLPGDEFGGRRASVETSGGGGDASPWRDSSGDRFAGPGPAAGASGGSGERLGAGEVSDDGSAGRWVSVGGSGGSGERVGAGDGVADRGASGDTSSGEGAEPWRGGASGDGFAVAEGSAGVPDGRSARGEESSTGAAGVPSSADYGSSMYEETKAELARMMSALHKGNLRIPPAGQSSDEPAQLPAPSRPGDDHPRNGAALPRQSIPTPPDPDEVPEPPARPDVPDPHEPDPIPPAPPDPGPTPPDEPGPLTPPSVKWPAEPSRSWPEPADPEPFGQGGAATSERPAGYGDTAGPATGGNAVTGDTQSRGGAVESGPTTGNIDWPAAPASGTPADATPRTPASGQWDAATSTPVNASAAGPGPSPARGTFGATPSAREAATADPAASGPDATGSTSDGATGRGPGASDGTTSSGTGTTSRGPVGQRGRRSERSSDSTTIAGLLAEALAAYQETTDEPDKPSEPARPAEPDNDFDRLFDWRYQSPASGRHRSPE